MGRRITILGMGPSARERLHDIDRYCEGTEIWSLNNAYLTYPALTRSRSFDRFFELHAYDYLRTWVAGTDANGQPVDHFAGLHNLGCEIVTGQHLPVIQNQTQIDWEGVFGHFGSPVYFLGSPSVMLALALYEHDNGNPIDYIQSWGIDTSDPSHAQQRHSWAMWIGRALDRGIAIGGTALGFVREFENDEGLRGIREMIEERLASRRKVGTVSDYAVVSFCTDDSYYLPKMRRLQAQAESLGLQFVSRVFPVPPGQTAREVAKTFPETIIRELLAEAGKPILYIDADDELLARPVFPVCEVGVIRNPELDQIDTHLPLAPFVFLSPGELSDKFLAARESAMRSGANGHRALCAAWMLHRTKPNPHGIIDVSEYAKGCISYSPSPIGHRPKTLHT